MSIFLWLNQLYEPIEAGDNGAEAPFLNKKGIVIESIGSGDEGVIKLQGVYWTAKSSVPLRWPIPANTPVMIEKRIGLTLIVRPLATEGAAWPLSSATAPSRFSSGRFSSGRFNVA